MKCWKRRDDRRRVGDIDRKPITSSQSSSRVLTIFSLASGVVLDAAMGPAQGKKTGENTLFRSLQEAFQPGDVMLGDRLFCSFQDLATQRARSVDVVVRQHQSRLTDFRRGQSLGTLDHGVQWQRPAFSSRRFERAT